MSRLSHAPGQIPLLRPRSARGPEKEVSSSPMKSPWMFAFLGSLVGGGLSSWVTHWALSPPEVTAEKPAKTSRPTAKGRDADEEGEGSEEVNERLRKLEHRLSVMTRAVAQRSNGEPGQDDDDDGRLLPEGASDVADPVFEAAVLDIMDREVERKAEEQDTWRKELQVERSKRFASELGKQLTLATQEQEKIAQIITEHFESFRALRDSPDRPVTRREWTEKSAELQAALEQRMKEALSPAQYQIYQELPPEDKIGFFPGRGERSGREGSRENSERRNPER